MVTPYAILGLTEKRNLELTRLMHEFIYCEAKLPAL